MAQFFTPRETITRKLADGREIQAAVAGVPMSVADALFYEVLEDADFAALGIQKPADYGKHYRNAPAAPAGGASTLTETARTTTTTTRAAADTTPQGGATSTPTTSAVTSPGTATGGEGGRGASR